MKAALQLVLTTVLLAGVAAAQSFSAPTRYNLHESAGGGFVVGDVNHDGFLDVLALQPSSHSVSVMLNDKTGALHQVGLYDAGSDVVGIAVGDFNGDGKLDMAVANYHSKTVSVLLGNGNGTFQPRKSYLVDGGPNSIAVGDFNNDGKIDIATLSSDSAKITILTNTGTGFTKTSFAPPQYNPGNMDRLYALTAGDFNADGRMDLAYVDQCGNFDVCPPEVPLENLVALFNTTAGWQGHVAGSGTGTWTLHAVDVDNDGKADLVTTYFGCHTPCTGVNVFYSNGDGRFQEVFAFEGGGEGGDPYDAVVADINNDGINDIVSPVESGYDPITNTPVSNGIAVYIGKGGRSGFKNPVFFSSGGGDSPRVIGGGFFRAQTRKDIVADDGSANHIVEFRNTTSVAGEPCAYPVSPAVHYCGPANGSTVVGPNVTFTATARAQNGPVNRIELWIDGHKMFQTFNDRLLRAQALAKGVHSAAVVEVDSAGKLIKVTVPKFTVK